MNKKIYVVDDEKNILNLIEDFLKNSGYEVTTFDNGKDMLDSFKNDSVDLVILDIMMPGMDGYECCQELRKTSSVPIIFLTAKDTELDYVRGITIGSDDYLTKPFSPTLLLMRIKALLRRVEMSKTTTNKTDIHFIDIEYISDKNMILCNKKKLDLTQLEFRLLIYMLNKPERIYSRDELLENVWGYETVVETRVTDETVRRLRKKLTLANSKVYIETVWGFGYKLSYSE